jgi:outer membrane biogenesis lipoprotein LolB
MTHLATFKFKLSINGNSPMKKLLLISLAALLLPACADKKQYEQAVLEQMQKEQDIKDYKIAPEYMTKCVVDTTSENMPGIFAFDPKRLMAYRNYTKIL